MVGDVKDLLVQKELPSLLEKPGASWDGTPYEVNLTFSDSREVLGYVLPGLYVEKNTSLNLKVNEEGRVDGNVTSGRLALGGRYLKDFKLDFDNRDDALHASLTGSAINLGGLELRGNRLDLTADNDRFRVSYTFDNQEEEANKADLRFEGSLSRPSGTRATAGTWIPTRSPTGTEISTWSASASRTMVRASSWKAGSLPSGPIPSPSAWTGSTFLC